MRQYVVIEQSNDESLSPSERIQRCVGPFDNYPAASAYAVILDEVIAAQNEDHFTEVVSLDAPED